MTPCPHKREWTDLPCPFPDCHAGTLRDEAVDDKYMRVAYRACSPRGLWVWHYRATNKWEAP